MDLWAYLPDYSLWAPTDFAQHYFWGLMGALVRISNNNEPIKLPNKTRDGIKLNVFGSIFTGAMVGMLINHNPLFGVIAGMTAPALVEIAATFVDRRIIMLAPEESDDSD